MEWWNVSYWVPSIMLDTQNDKHLLFTRSCGLALVLLWLFTIKLLFFFISPNNVLLKWIQPFSSCQFNWFFLESIQGWLGPSAWAWNWMCSKFILKFKVKLCFFCFLDFGEYYFRGYHIARMFALSRALLSIVSISDSPYRS